MMRIVSDQPVATSVTDLSKNKTKKLRKEVLKEAREADKDAVDAVLTEALGWMQDGGPRRRVATILREVQDVHRSKPLGPDRLAELESLRAATSQMRTSRPPDLDEWGFADRFEPRDGTRSAPRGVDGLLDMFDDKGAFMSATTVGVGGGWMACGFLQAGLGTQTRPTGERLLNLTVSGGLAAGVGAMVAVTRSDAAVPHVHDHKPSHTYRQHHATYSAMGIGRVWAGSPLARSPSPREADKIERGLTVGGGTMFMVEQVAVSLPLKKLTPSLTPIRETLGIALQEATMPETLLRQAMEERLAAVRPQVKAKSIEAAKSPAKAKAKALVQTTAQRAKVAFSALHTPRRNTAPRPTLVFPEVPTHELEPSEKSKIPEKREVRVHVEEVPAS